MTCREIEAEITRLVAFSPTSHGCTCCSCDRLIRDAWQSVRIGTWNLQACSESCAIILARWIAHRQDPRVDAIGGVPLCLAHTCIAVNGEKKQDHHD